jgi:hypothetical protein
MSYAIQGAVAYDPYRISSPANPSTHRILSEVTDQVISIYRAYLIEQKPGYRTGRIRKSAIISAETLVANAIQASDAPADNIARDKILSALEAYKGVDGPPLIVQGGSGLTRNRHATTVQLGEDIADKLTKAGDASMTEHSPSIISSHLEASSERVVVDGGAVSEELADTLEHLKAGVRQLNAAVAKGCYSYRGIPLSAPTFYRKVTSDLEGNGRFWGSWITAHSSGKPDRDGQTEEGRLQLLRIDGEAVAHVDLSAAFLSMAYASLGSSMPDGDAYKLEGLNEPGDREAIKRFACAMLSAKKPIKQWPQTEFDKNGGRARRIAGSIERQLKGRVTPSALRKMIGRKHTSVSEAFFDGNRLPELTRHESDIIVAAVLQCRAEGFTAVPVHDCLVVTIDNSQRAQSILAETFASHFGLRSMNDLNLPAPTIETA